MHCGKNMPGKSQVLLLPATASTTRSRAATTTRAYRFNRGDTESGARPGVNVVYGNSTTGGQKAFFNKKF